MRKFIWLFVCLMTMVVSLTSCSSTYSVIASYDVCFPDGTRTYEGSAIVKSNNEPIVSCYSYGGTNYLSVITTKLETTNGKNKNAENITSSTAPMRLNSYKVKQIKGKKKQVTDDGMYMGNIIKSRKTNY